MVGIKNISKLMQRREEKKVLILDNCPFSYEDYFDNFIPVPEFQGDDKDPCLFYLINYLRSYVMEDDLQRKVREDFITIHQAASVAFM